MWNGESSHMNAVGLRRKKEPEAVRRALLDAALQLGYEKGMAGVTVQAVADRAGVTKGGLFHHFASKEALLEGLFLDIIAQTDAEIDRLMAEDSEKRGSFTRAYIRVMLRSGDFTGDQQWAGLSASFMADPSINRHWLDWIASRQALHADTDGDPRLQIIRYAVDGAWHTFMDLVPQAGSVDDLVARLIAMTREGER